MPQEPSKRDDHKTPGLAIVLQGKIQTKLLRKAHDSAFIGSMPSYLPFLIGFQLFGPFSPNMAKIKSLEFRSMVMNGEVEKYTIIDNRKTVKVFLTADAQRKYEKRLKTGFSGKKEDGPHMYFKITSGDAFQKEMSDFYKANPTVKEIPLRSG